MDKLLSIIVPSYNMEKYLPKCLGSLIVDDKELLRKLDVIVVNDGSKDCTSEIAHEFEAKYPGVFRVIDKPNGNYGSCINASLLVAEGAFSKVLDADDWFDAAELRQFIQDLEGLVGTGSVPDVVMTDFDEVDQNGCVANEWRYSFGVGEVFTADDIVSRKVRMSMHAVTNRTEHLRAIGYIQTEGVSYTDTEWFYRPIGMAKAIVYFPRCLYKYLVARAGQTVERSAVIKNDGMMLTVLHKMVSEYQSCVSIAGCSRAYLGMQICRVAAYLARVEAESASCLHAVLMLCHVSKTLMPVGEVLNGRKAEFELRVLRHCVTSCVPKELAACAIVAARRLFGHK